MELIEINCPICHSEKKSTKWKVENWKVVECQKCKFRYTDPRPQNIAEYYSAEYFKDHRHYKKFFDEEGKVKEKSGNYTNRLVDIESHFDERGSLLEIGAARGEYLNVMKQRGWEVDGVEISEDAVHKARELYQIDLFRGILEDYKPEKQFNVVCMYQTLEHVEDPLFVVKKSHELLNTGGILVIEVPNTDSFDFKRSRKRKMDMLDLPRHLNHFNKRSLTQLVENNGFEIVECDLYLPDYLLSLLKAFQKNSPKQENQKSQNGKANAKSMARKTESWKYKVLKKLAAFTPGWRITVIARKN